MNRHAIARGTLIVLLAGAVVLAYLERNAASARTARNVVARLDFAAMGKVRPS